MSVFFRKKRLAVTLPALFIILVGGVFWYVKQAQGVTRTWDGGGGDANWNTALNWSGDTVPTSSDVASFDGTCVSNCSPTINVSLSGATAPAGINMAVDYTGTITQSSTFTITIGASNWVQAGGTFTGGSGAITLNGAFTLSGGTFTSTTGTLTISGTASTPLTLFTHTAGGTFNHNNGTVYLYSVYSAGGNGGTYTVDVATSETFNNLTVYVYGNGGNLVVASGDTLIVLGTLTHTDGKINTGTLEARGNVFESSGVFGGGTALLSFTGANDQTYTKSGSTEPDGDITLNKTGGVVALASAASWNASGQDLTITSGALKVGSSYALSTTALTVGASGVLKMVGTGDLTLAGNVSNSGQIIIESNGVCGGADDIQILSSVAGTQRSWSGAGTATIYDATIKDQGGSSAITVYSSTSVSGNGVNWTFSGASCPAIPPAANITSGILNITSGIVNFR